MHQHYGRVRTPWAATVFSRWLTAVALTFLLTIVCGPLWR